MSKALLYMSLGAAFIIGAEVYLLKKDDINYNMKKIMKNPDKAVTWLKKHM